MKKILYLCPRYVATVSGVETYLSSLIRYMSKNYEIHLITRYEPCLKNSTELGLVNIHYIDGFDSLNVNLYKALPKLRKLLVDINPDIVHIHCAMSLFLYKAITLPNEFPLIVTMHSTPDGFSRLFGWFNDFDTEKLFCRSLFSSLSVNALIFGSDYYKTQYISSCPEMTYAKKVITNHYFSNLPGLSFNERKALKSKKENNTVHILFPSRILKRKGIEETLQVMTLLPKEYILVLPSIKNIENAEYSSFILEKIEQLNLLNRVLLPDHMVFPDEMDLYYKQADIVIIPSYYEGFGIVAVEAMDYCVPVISTCAGGLAEIIQPNLTGYRIELKDLESVRDTIINGINNSFVSDNIVIAAKAKVKTDFSLFRHMSVIDSIYIEILTKHNE